MRLRSKRGIPISGVKPGSLADQQGIKAGDSLLTVNGITPRDTLEYSYLVTSEELWLKIRRREGNLISLRFRKDQDTDPGLIFPVDCFDGLKRCRNRCIFCFIDQLPPGLRSALYIKDDDYRMSLLHGNFITLTNLTSRDLDRILTFHLSPLYLSVHTTDPVLRGKMLGRRHPAPVLDKIARLARGGITLHLQIVLCPDWNDGEVLDQTIKELAPYWPQVASIGIVPVGITRFRGRLPFLRNLTSCECHRLIRRVSRYQRYYRDRLRSSLVYLADEFYLRGGYPLPRGELYDDYPQLENGIGISRVFYDEFRQLLPLLPEALVNRRELVIATGAAGAKVLKPVVARLNLIKNLKLILHPITNVFFGPRVTVTGLLTGRDLLWGLRGLRNKRVLLPEVLLRKGTSLLLDGLTLDQVAGDTGCRLQVVANTAGALVKAVLGQEVDHEKTGGSHCGSSQCG